MNKDSLFVGGVGGGSGSLGAVIMKYITGDQYAQLYSGSLSLNPPGWIMSELSGAHIDGVGNLDDGCFIYTCDPAAFD